MSFICMRIKNDFHIKGWAPTLVLKQRLGETLKWPVETAVLLFRVSVFCKSKARVCVLFTYAYFYIWLNSFGTSCYRIMLKITQINGVLNATIYSLTETAPLKLKEPGQFGNRVSLVMCSASLKASLSENLQRLFLLIGGGNPEESERCSPVIITVFLRILIAC